MNYQQLQNTVTGHVQAIEYLELQEQSMYEVLLEPPSDDNIIAPVSTWKFIPAGRTWERRSLWEVRDQVLTQYLALQGYLEPMARFNPQVTNVWKMRLLQQMRAEELAYLAVGSGGDGQRNLEEVTRNRELMLRFTMAGHALADIALPAASATGI